MDGLLKRPYLVLTVATLVCLLFGLGQAYHVDEPLFVWSAEQILTDPLDFYGFDVNWYGAEEPMHGVMKNPPLAAYYAAAAGAVFGLGETGLHFAFLFPALGLVLGTYRLALRYCSRPWLAALLVLVNPFFLVSAPGVTSDVAMLCLWVWATVFWVEGLESGSKTKLFGGAALIAAAALTKYFGAALLPLLAAYTLVRERRDWRRLFWLLVPIALLAGYQIWTQRLYGRGLLLDAADYATTHRELSLVGLGQTSLIALCFAGGCMLLLLDWGQFLWSRRVVVSGIAAGAFLALLSWYWLPDLAPLATGIPGWMLAAQIGVLSLCGAGAVALGAAELYSSRDADAFLLAGWLLGTFFFAGFVNWAINARSILPMSVAALILAVRRLDACKEPLDPRRLVGTLAALSLVAFPIAWSDVATAGAQRTAAAELVGAYAEEGRTLWFQGHWGFQYYMERLGARPLNIAGTRLEEGDRMVLPRNNTNVQRGPLAHVVRTLEVLELPLDPDFVSTLDPRRGAGFYYHAMGPLPFVFGPASPEEFEVVELTGPLNVEAQRR